MNDDRMKRVGNIVASKCALAVLSGRDGEALALRAFGMLAASFCGLISVLEKQDYNTLIAEAMATHMDAALKCLEGTQSYEDFNKLLKEQMEVANASDKQSSEEVH